MKRRRWLALATGGVLAALVRPAGAAVAPGRLLERASRAGALTQRAARLWLMQALEVPAPQLPRLLRETMAEVDGELVQLPGLAPDGDSLVRVRRLADAWGLMQGPLKAPPAADVAKPLADAGEAAFNAALAMIKTLAARLRPSGTARVLELAAILRLESQRMARLFYLARIPDTEIAAHAGLLRSREVMPRGLQEMEAVLDPALKPAFDLVGQQWFFMERALKLPAAEAARASTDVATSAEGLLAAFDDLARKAAR